MNNIYSTIIIFFDKNNKFKFQETANLIKENQNKKISNYFIEKYYYDEFDFSNINQKDYYHKIFQLLPPGSKIIIDLSSETYFNPIEIRDKYKDFNYNIFYSFSINLKTLKDYSKGHDYLYKLFKHTDNRLYLEMPPQLLAREETINIIAENNIKGIILETDYAPDLDIGYLEEFKSINSNLDIIYKADDLYLTALKNSNSIISSYAGILTEEFNRIWQNFQQKKMEEAIMNQEDLNVTLKKLQSFNIFKVIKFYFDYKIGVKGKNEFLETIELSCGEKNKLEKILTTS